MIVTAIIYLLLHLLPVWCDTSLLWGVDSWSYYPQIISILLFVTSTILIFLSFNRYVLDIVKKISDFLRKIPFFIWIIIFGLLLIFLSQKLFLLGDGLLRIRNTQAGFMFSPAEPMDTWLHSWLYKVLKPVLNITSSDIYHITSIFSGLFSIIGVYFYLKKIFPKSYYKRLFIGLSFFLCGSVQLFFGYVESYSIMVCFVILFLFAAINLLENEKFSLIPMLFLSFGIIFHPLAIVLLPSALFFYIKIIKRIVINKAKAYILISLAFAFPILLMLCLFLIQGYDLNKFFYTAKSDFFLPLFSTTQTYGIISFEHLIDVLNLIFLISPSIIAVHLIKKTKFKSKSFLLISTISLLLFSIIFKPDLGFSRDWDLFSTLAFPFSLLVIFSIVNTTNNLKKSYVLIVIFVSLFHTIPWLINNSSEELSLKRTENLANTYFWSPHSKAILFDEISQYYYDKNLFNKALELMEKAYHYEANERFLYSLGVINNELGNKDYAIAIFEKLKYSGYMKYNINLFLGNIYFEKKRYDEAEKCYVEALNINPQNEDIAFNLGFIYYSSNKLNEASNYFKTALRINPNNIETLKYLGQIYFDLQNYKDAAYVFRKAEVLNPTDSKIDYYIALCYANLGLFKESLKYLEKSKLYGLDSISYQELHSSIIKNYNNKKY